MKKILTAIVLSIPFFALTGCNNDNSIVKGETAESLAFEATTSLAMMNRLSTNSSSMLKRAYQEPTESEIQEITDYLEQIDFILMNDQQFKQESVVSDREDYLYQELITFADFDGEAKTYSLYYNSIKESTDIDEKDDEIEIKTKIQGIAVFEDKTYDFRCHTKVEEERGEKEESVTFTLYEDHDSYVRVEQEVELEDDEYSKEYRYTIVADGQKTYDYRLEYEEETKHQQLEKEIELKLNDKQFKIKEETREDGAYLRVRYVDKQDEVKYSILFKKVIETVDGVTTIHYEYIAQ